MSTFDGKVAEFPDIRIDYFRSSGSDSRPPLALFLSHVHSDHTVGLESCKSPFIYCSPGTRDILLRLEKYRNRMNFAKGILETRKQTYRHLKNLLKAIPLETPTTIELCPGTEIRVTLLDANHCVGGVMFLIDGGGKAILYTGDIRSEVWWVNSLKRSPALLPYLPLGNDKSERTLDSIYLDTTFIATGKEDMYVQFPSKDDGLREMLRKVAQYPSDTLFYFDAWTFGYEDVWLALATFLGSPIHLDDYRYGLYRALANGIDPKAPESAKLMGFYCGNHFQEGCLTTKQSRIHSCEKGTGCEIWNKDFVRITPIVSRHNGNEIVEVGAGGGQGDLNQQHELEVGDAEAVGQLMALCASKLCGQTQLLSSVLEMLTSTINERLQLIRLTDFNSQTDTIIQSPEDNVDDLDEVSLEKLVPALTKVVMKAKHISVQSTHGKKSQQSLECSKRSDGLAKRITFPYSRHSSYHELCLLIEAFRPKNIHPCTVDGKNWTHSKSMESLFGHIYRAPPSFRHDQKMLARRSSEDHADADGDCRTAPSEYATPKSDAFLTNEDRIQNAPPSAFKPPSSTKDVPERRTEASNKSSVRQRKRDRQSQGDYWPPLDVDHYSPGRKRRQSPGASRLDQVARSDEKDRPNLTLAEAPPLDQLAKDWRKRVAEAMLSERQHRKTDASSLKDGGRRSTNYGRLSPPSEGRKMADVDVDVRDHLDQFVKDQNANVEQNLLRLKETDIRESPLLSSPGGSRLAYRQEVYDAVLRNSWSEIGLVSANGHQEKEEEL